MIILKWQEFEYNNYYNTMQKRLHQEQFDYNINIHTEDIRYEPYDWEEDIWNLKMELE